MSVRNDSRMTSVMKWVNPCGLTEQDSNSESDVETLSDRTVLTQLQVVVKNALASAESKREEFAQKHFHVSFEELHGMFKNHRFDWLPKIDKQLGEKLSIEYLKSLNIPEELIKTFRSGQVYSVALEQVVWDKQDPRYKSTQKVEFQHMENNLRAVLCELQVVLAEFQITPGPDVLRDIMSDEIRNTSSETYRNLRDWLIYRDYMNSLEYLDQMVEFELSRLP